MIDGLLQARVGAGIFCLFMAGCGSTNDVTSSEEVGSARLGQIYEGPKDFRQYDFAFVNDAPLASVLVIGPSAIGGFSANTEYWYVETSSLQYLGAQDLEITYSDDEGTPPSLSGDQEFTQAVNLTWNSFSSDPVSAGELYENGDVYLRIKTDSGEISRLTWYQTVDDNAAPANVTPELTFSAVSGSVGIPSGDDGYYIDATIE